MLFSIMIVVLLRNDYFAALWLTCASVALCLNIFTKAQLTNYIVDFISVYWACNHRHKCLGVIPYLSDQLAPLGIAGFVPFCRLLSLTAT